MKMELPLWYDLHAHFRQGDIMPTLVKDHLAMGCAGILAMPNTSPPLARVQKIDAGGHSSIENYIANLMAAGADQFDSIIVPLYLTHETNAHAIVEGKKSGILKACKYYPPHGTTGASHAAPLETYMENGVFQAMEDMRVVLCIHGEEHDLSGEDYFDRSSNAEEIFYRERMPRLIEKFPNLKIVCEHVTTAAAVKFVEQTSNKVAATITPQHLLYTVGDLLKGFKYHLYCLPLLKFEEDRVALRAAVMSPDNTKFFAGTDSAPHVNKTTPCGCAAGCYTGGIAPQLYAQAFEESGADFTNPQHVEIFKKFLCTIGPEFYDLKPSQKTFVLEKKPQTVTAVKVGTEYITPLPLGMSDGIKKSVDIPWRIVR